ncbi:acetyltransferase [Ramlibacter sp. AW1]|uniref:Acetyltransferase n=1 Tax=Ramlibacter aurantiacus TaxID=2801330 RepID=A0A936ZS21_9BURK|nr:acetyltransferase [Ramlibacter aurantiacus]MBL0419579.1 acetyltransferase [Ramlibacter aurantiacus]
MRIVLLGAGGHASDLLAALDAIRLESNAPPSHLDIAGYMAEGEVRHDRFSGRSVKFLGSFDNIATVGATHFVPCVGYPRGRQQVAAIGLRAALKPYTIVHPRAYVPPTAVVGPGCQILANACVSPLAALGAFVLIGQGAIVGHDCKIGDFSAVMPAACLSGDVVVGAGTLIGANSTVIEGLSIGPEARVGAGAVVTRDVPAGVTAVGVPARW